MGERGRGLEAARVAEILVECAGGASGRRGSGYRVGPACVLTAAHILAGEVTSVRVRFDADRPGEWSTACQVVLLDESADVALLELMDVPPGRGSAPPPPYAAVPDTDVVLPFSAVGFPRFKLRKDDMRLLDDGSPSQYRDSCHVSGSLSVLSNRREGTLELAVAAPPADVEPGRSPWEGMSGAVVWSGGAVIGMVSVHHRADGLGTLAARRVERWYEALSLADLEQCRRRAGLPPRAGLPLAVDRAGRRNSGRSSGVGDDTAAPRPVPVPVSFAGLPTDPTLHEIADLVDALTALASLRSGSGLSLVLDLISDRVAANSPRDPRLRMDLYGIVRTCLRYPGTLEEFLQAVRVVEGETVDMERVDQVAARLALRYG
ncbi:trypsin-like peptidase domain-containing protein [Streptomyces sp. AS02]|uniref:effector-associated domain 2-containing protein n=1 Tax=Streptomyces sp. AS02 TaxID=2938946 RepID=UPI0020203049|nr:trypsin-like peptidase domain-containing protein [Streptomyces sp. AS02]MCL8013628.1 trypsin-like peptidase domain-containing protein [Streptomyces sp. AS02]